MIKKSKSWESCQRSSGGRSLSFMLVLSLFYTASPANPAKVAKAAGYGLSNTVTNIQENKNGVVGSFPDSPLSLTIYDSFCSIYVTKQFMSPF